MSSLTRVLVGLNGEAGGQGSCCQWPLLSSRKAGLSSVNLDWLVAQYLATAGLP